MRGLKLAIISAIAFGMVVLVLAYAAYRSAHDPLEVAFKYPPSNSTGATIENDDDIHSINLIETKNYTLAQIKDLDATICHRQSELLQNANQSDPNSYDEFLPQLENFTYLKTKYTVMKIFCFYTPNGLLYMPFVVDKDGKLLLDSIGSPFYPIETPEQAFEFLLWMQKIHVLKTEQELSAAMEGCDKLASPPMNNLNIVKAEDGTEFIINTPVFEEGSGFVVFDKWQVPINATSITRLDRLELANCHSVV